MTTEAKNASIIISAPITFQASPPPMLPTGNFIITPQNVAAYQAAMYRPPEYQSEPLREEVRN